MANYTNSNLAGQLSSALQNTISITGAQGSTASPWVNSTAGLSLSLDDILVDTHHGSHVKKYQVLEIEEDLLALSTTWKRLRDAQKNGGPYIGISKLLDKELFKYVTEQDRNKAQEIRDYYSKKIMMWKLKGQTLTKFREDMNSLIHSQGKMFKDDMLPLAYRLPEFHEYDVGFDELTNNHSKIIKDSPPAKITKTLSLKQTFIVGKRYSKRKEYWFVDENDNLVTISFPKDNPLLSLLDKSSINSIDLNGLYNKRSRDNVDYYVAEKFSF